MGQSVPIARANFCANVCVSMTVACRSELFSSLVIVISYAFVEYAVGPSR
jgi:hypothetical protein